MGKAKETAGKIKDSIKFATEKPSSPDFGKSRPDWNKAKGKGK